MIAIRGATTIEKDEKDAIRIAVKELLTEIETKNSLNRSEIILIIRLRRQGRRDLRVARFFLQPSRRLTGV